jgi:hypothetical protein
LVRRHRQVEDVSDVVAFYGELLIGVQPGEGFRRRLNAALGAKAVVSPEMARQIVTLILASPEGQLG